LTAPPVPTAVIDTNIVLDLFVYKDPKYQQLREDLQSGRLVWHATQAMRQELAAVLHYPQIAKRLAIHQQTPQDVLTAMDQSAHWVLPAPKSPFTCKDKDDQMFVDLASQRQCLLFSKDKAILALRSRLARLGATVTVAGYTL
jgi:putative PIN family toxin of toxin-antitoxin system